MDFSVLNASIASPSREAEASAREKWNSIAKPLGSLGLLEDMVVKIAALTGSAAVNISKRAVFVFCADNGIVEEGVPQADASVTMAVARNLTKKQTSVCRMAKAVNCDVFPVDMGMNAAPDFDGLISKRAGNGTKNFTKEPAMTRGQAKLAIGAGIELARDLKSRGYAILATGEMGIGNTTTSSAVCSAILKLPAAEVTGRGSGLSDLGLAKKIAVIEKGVDMYMPKAQASDQDRALTALSCLGGFDIAAMAGVFIGGAIYRIPVLIDGFISSVAALVASMLCPKSTIAALPSHISGEPAGLTVLHALGLKPLICAGMRLGEGTGAVAALPLLDLALTVYNSSSSFDELGIESYTPQ
ncbi:MAG: nicotinate-nucleotide--dimethylbenzimidazole phosphoribosyltransferase [Clostridiales bacterium]|nr:nicotinate-nucleotide--dimethylbenzimidazole phosphoribosyltransferase [Clostridiales bacterium]